MDVWSETIRRFGDTPRFDDSGSWSIAVDCSMKTIGELLAAAPAGFLSEVVNTPLLDGSAQEVDVESSHGVMTNWKERALIRWSDHWQAGLTATLTVFTRRDTFLGAHAAACTALEQVRALESRWY